MVINILNLSNMIYSIDFKPLVKLLLSLALVSIVFYTMINNVKYTVSTINMYTPPADTVIIKPPVH